MAAVGILACCVLLAGFSDVASAGQPKLCANAYGGDLVYAKNVSCKKGRKVVRGWGLKNKRQGKVNSRVRGFRCIGTFAEAEGLVVTCRRGKKRVSFYANVP